MTKYSFKETIITFVKRIPEGKVTTYGTLAALAGKPRAVRLVAGVLHHAEDSLPWQRVINRVGYLSIRGCHYDKAFQKKLLEQEGVEVSDDFVVDLEKYGWFGQTQNAKVKNQK